MSAAASKKPTRGQEAMTDIAALIKSRAAALWIVSREEARVERGLVDACATANYIVKFWDCAKGLQNSAGKVIDGECKDPAAAIGALREAMEEVKGREVWVLRDMHAWLKDPTILRGLRSLARDLPETDRDFARAFVVLAPSGEIPAELAAHVTVVDWPLPDREEVAAIYDEAIEVQAPSVKKASKDRDGAIDAAVGLTAGEVEACYAKSIVTLGSIDGPTVAREKRRVISRERVLEWHDPDPRGLDAVGGLDLLKEWSLRMKAAFGSEAREYGLPAPRGALLLGIPGCGKSLCAKALAAAWGMPLLRLDMGALKSKYVGESESNLRRALQVAEAVSPCILWLDEIEKALAGATQGAADGGVSADALGAILSWMQERRSPVFVLATSNDVRSLPAELLRRGRFDGVWWVDLPTNEERVGVVTAALAQYKRTEDGVDAAAVAEATNGFTGAEIASLVPDALGAAFADGKRPLRTADLLAAAKDVVPLAATASERIAQLREWAQTRCRMASKGSDRVSVVDVATKIKNRFDVPAGGN